MTDRPKPNNPLAPYYPAETPSIPGNARTWFAVLMTAILLSGAVYSALAYAGIV
ncbi:MAG: hypothetical protein SVG88_12655 [Halobacteriales archaeon]|nr:hypothetical protein [Halobacteriales archaeon]